MAKKYLVTAASGKLGSKIVKALLSRVDASDIVAMVRREEAAAALRAEGVEVRFADYDDTAALDRAMAGIDRVLLISGMEFGKRVQQHENVILAAKKAGVEYLAYTSVLRADQSSLGVAPDHVATEKVLAAAGQPYGVLRNGWYTENYTGNLAQALDSGSIFGAAGDARLSPAARADYAEAAAALITMENPKDGVIYELAGSQTFTMADFAAMVSEAAGRTVNYVDVSTEEYAAVLSKAGLPEAIAAFLAGNDAAARKGDLEGNDTDLRALIGRGSTPVSTVIGEALVPEKV